MLGKKVKLVTKKNKKDVKEIGIGVLGYGFMGKAHVNGYQKMPVFFYPPPANPRLHLICGRTRKAVEEAAEKFNFEGYCTEWKDIVMDDRIELVDNCLPNNMHAAPCVAAAESGKNILCEKPLAMNVKEAEIMFKAAEKAGVKHMTAFNYRFVPAIRLAKKLIDEGYIGRILQYRSVYLQEWIMDPKFPRVWRLMKSVSGSGALGDLGAHIIDLARFLVDDIAAVSATAETFIKERPLPGNPDKLGEVNVDDAFIAIARFKKGAIGSFEASRFCAGRKNFQRIEIHGTEGSIVFNLERLNELNVYSKEDMEDRMGFRNILVTESMHPFIERWWPQGHIIGWEHTFIHEIHHFINCIVNDKSVAPMGATFNDGLKCQRILSAIEESSHTERWITVSN